MHVIQWDIQCTSVSLLLWVSAWPASICYFCCFGVFVSSKVIRLHTCQLETNRKGTCKGGTARTPCSYRLALSNNHQSSKMGSLLPDQIDRNARQTPSEPWNTPASRWAEMAWIKPEACGTIFVFTAHFHCFHIYGIWVKMQADTSRNKWS